MSQTLFSMLASGSSASFLSKVEKLFTSLQNDFNVLKENQKTAALIILPTLGLGLFVYNVPAVQVTAALVVVLYAMYYANNESSKAGSAQNKFHSIKEHWKKDWRTELPNLGFTALTAGGVALALYYIAPETSVILASLVIGAKVCQILSSLYQDSTLGKHNTL